jgi:dCTP deaminase
VSLLDAPRFIGRDSLIGISLDNGETIFCTPDHEFIRRDGALAQAYSLRPGDSLMPIYRQLFRGYEMVYQPINGHLTPTHRLADEWNIRNGVYEDQPDTHRHHIDEDRANNMPWNILRMKSSDHIRYHNSRNYGRNFDSQEHSASIRAAFARLRQDGEWSRRYSELQRSKARRFWDDDAYLESRRRFLEQHRAYWTIEAREQQRVIARQMNTRFEITEEIVKTALDQTGSIRGAARLLQCDRSVFRRFPHVIQAFRGKSPRNHRVVAVSELKGDHDVYCLTVPEAGNFALEAGVFVRNCGLMANTTPLEADWSGRLVVELYNAANLPVRLYAEEGFIQILFFESDEDCETSYSDRGGKYQDQKGLTLAKV